METKALGKLLSHLAHMESLLFRLLKGASAVSRVGGVRGLQCVKGYSSITHDPLRLTGA